jgi:hypothetical protein
MSSSIEYLALAAVSDQEALIAVVMMTNHIVIVVSTYIDMSF